MTRGRYQHLAPPSKLAIEASSTSSEFAGFELKEATWPEDLKFWTEVVKEDLRTSGVDRQFRRDVRFRRIWNRDEWIDSVQALAEDREGWAELCSRTAHLGEDAGNSVRDEISPPIKFKRLPFGVTASPSILKMCLTSFLNSQNMDLAAKIAKNLYVDNIMMTVDTVEEALQKYRKFKILFAKVATATAKDAWTSALSCSPKATDSTGWTPLSLEMKNGSSMAPIPTNMRGHAERLVGSSWNLPFRTAAGQYDSYCLGLLRSTEKTGRQDPQGAPEARQRSPAAR
ncbi:hypothetical protein RB195_019431 [Necator americanus]|uniref:Reverse transcriptase domain-containing protein n=1 Tax=Necator americanus TaxID=51031 RepID=A0ABR1CH01_NECAM